MAYIDKIQVGGTNYDIQDSALKSAVNKFEGGTTGQFLKKKSGTDYDVEWSDSGGPTDEQVETAVSEWLESHPEATTTVQDGSLTEVKLSNALKLKTINDYVTPKMFGAAGDGETDDTAAVKGAASTGKPLNLEGLTYLIKDTIEATNIIYNGSLVIDALVDYGIETNSSVNDLTISGTEYNIDAGICFNGYTEAAANRVTVKHISNLSGICAGLLFMPTEDGAVFEVNNCHFSDIYSAPNSVVGDDAGSASGVHINSSYITTGSIKNSYFIDIKSTEDAAGCRLVKGVGDANSRVEIANCYFSGCQKDAIKAAFPCVIRNNIIDMDWSSGGSTQTAGYGVRIMSNDVIVDNNFISLTGAGHAITTPDGSNMINCEIINNHINSGTGNNVINILGSNTDALKRIKGNVITSQATSNTEGLIFVNDSGVVLVEENTIVAANNKFAIKAQKNTRISRNKSTSGIIVIYFTGEITDNRCGKIEGTYSHDCVISGNTCGIIALVSNNTGNIKITGNMVSAASTDTYVILINASTAASNCIVDGNMSLNASVGGIVIGNHSESIIFTNNILNCSQDMLKFNYCSYITAVNNINNGVGTVTKTGSTNVIDQNNVSKTA